MVSQNSSSSTENQNTFTTLSVVMNPGLMFIIQIRSSSRPPRSSKKNRNRRKLSGPGTLKKKVASFVTKIGYIATIVLEDRKKQITLPQVVIKFRKKNPKRHIILHHDNASSYTARRTTGFLNEQNVEILNHPSNSPDLSPKDVTSPKISLHGQRFHTAEEAVGGYRSAISATQ